MAQRIKVGRAESLAIDFFLSGLSGMESGFDVVNLPRGSGIEAVRSGAVEMALVTALSVIADPDRLEVVPAVALSSWRYPFAQLFLPGGLDSSPERICYARGDSTEADIARILLKEHYRIAVPLEPCDAVTGDETASLRVGNSVPTMRFDGLRLDLGQEWYELAAYPMAWGVFVMRKGAVTPPIVLGLREMVERTELIRVQWADSVDRSESMRRFFIDDVRLRFDELVVASISELMHYAFYYDLTDEIREFPMASVEIDEPGEANPGRTPLL